MTVTTTHYLLRSVRQRLLFCKVETRPGMKNRSCEKQKLRETVAVKTVELQDKHQSRKSG